MGRNIVLGSDGTGNTPRSATNVHRLAGLLDLTDPERQVAAYDPGLGTVASVRAAAALADAAPARLTVLPAPGVHRVRPVGTAQRLAGLGFGYGLTENVRQLYARLAAWHEDGDPVFLFGFSRGAFTVRALAGLLHRCGLTASRDPAGIRRAFDAAWSAYRPMHPDPERVRAVRQGTRPCPVHFLGVWDTVKSYGGFRPVMLPHLRHNPAVGHVAHALALDERRARFKHTTWGRLDGDESGALTRVPREDLEQIRRQAIDEVWFAGAHGDVGSGDITLRWMLHRATGVEPGLLLNDAGTSFMDGADPQPEVHSRWGRWAVVEQLPRLEIDNSGPWPRRRWHVGSDGRRDPAPSARAGRVRIHGIAT